MTDQQIVQSQIAAHYKLWYYERTHQGTRKVQEKLKCNRCKQYFPREVMSRVKSGSHRQWTAYCPDCLAHRKPRKAR